MTSLADRMAAARRAQLAPEAIAPAAGPRRAVRTVDPFAAVKRSVHAALVETLGPRLYDAHMTQSELQAQVRQSLQMVLEKEETPLTLVDRTRIAQEVADDILGYGPLEPFLRDPDVTEIMVNGPSQIYVEVGGRLRWVDASFSDDIHLRRTIDKIVGRVGRRVDESSPMVDARLPDGSRVNAVVPPIALDGCMLTIRKFAAEPLTARDLVGLGTITTAAWQFIEAAIRGRANILIAGGTGSGKTTTLNVLSSAIPDDERIVTIEDAAELQLFQAHVLRLESRPSNVEDRGEITIRELVRNSLRMRPDRIVVGEVRDGAALDMLQAMNTGHDGSLSTVHANSARDALARLETMVLMAGVDLPIRAIREQVASALDLVVHQMRMKDGSRRIVQVSEVIGMEGDVITMQDIFVCDYSAGFDANGLFRGVLRPTGLRPHLLQRMSDHGVTVDASLFFDRLQA
ncbi:MAG: CpaF family protein [Actinomycetota bacterium]